MLDQRVLKSDCLGHLDVDGLEGARIGVLQETFGSDDIPESAATNRVIAKALDSMRSAGAELVDTTVPDLMHWIMFTSLYITHSRHDMNAFFASRPKLSFRTLDEIIETKRYHPMLDLFEDIARGPADPRDDPEYLEK